MEHRALGKGLSALIPDNFNLNENKAITQSIAYVKTERIKDSSLQPRKNYDEEKLDGLKLSIQEKGVLQPILVRKRGDDYEVVAGERRLRAARSINLDDVPVIIKDVSNDEALVLALVENIQREDLNPIEEALAFQRLLEDFSFSQDVIAKSVGKDRSTISNTLRLLKLPGDIQKAVVDGRIAMGHARTLINVEDMNEQQFLFNQIILKGLSVREIENLTKGKAKRNPRQKKVKEDGKDHETVLVEEELQKFLGTKVRVQSQRKRGKITIDYYSHDDLNRILNLIKQ